MTERSPGSEVGILPGQVWLDNDPRENGTRRIVVVEIHRDMHRNTGGRSDYAEVVAKRAGKKDRRSFVRLDRFNPNRRDGYTLIQDAS